MEPLFAADLADLVLAAGCVDESDFLAAEALFEEGTGEDLADEDVEVLVFPVGIDWTVEERREAFAFPEFPPDLGWVAVVDEVVDEVVDD